MPKNELRKLPPTYFTDDGWLKLPGYLILNFIFLAKGLMVGLFSLASRGSGNEIVNIFYNNVNYLYVDIAISIVPHPHFDSFD